MEQVRSDEHVLDEDFARLAETRLALLGWLR